MADEEFVTKKAQEFLAAYPHLPEAREVKLHLNVTKDYDRLRDVLYRTPISMADDPDI